MASKSQIQLSDLLEYTYPITTAGIQTIISEKKEYAELKSTKDERLPPGRGNFFSYQKFDHRFFRVYDSLLIISEPGVGKSCDVLGFTEQIIKENEKFKVDPINADPKLYYLKKIVILVKGPTQKNEIVNQIVCKCSDGRYEKILDQERDIKSLTRELKRVGYIIKSYQGFYNEYTKKDKEVFFKEYSNTFFWIDEVHNMLVDPDKKTYKLRTDLYEGYWQIFHTCKNIKVIMTSATPVVNNLNEFISIINLILPEDGILPDGFDYKNLSKNDKKVLFPNIPGSINMKTASIEEVSEYYQGQFPKDFNLNDPNIENIEPRIRGKIGYIRSPDTGTVNTEEGQEIEIINNKTEEIFLIDGEQIFKTKTSGKKNKGKSSNIRNNNTLFLDKMSKFQTKYYNKAKKLDEKSGGWMTQSIQASNFVFPDGSFGKPSVENKYIKILKDDNFEATAEFKNELRQNGVKKYSSKYFNIVNLSKESSGNVFVYVPGFIEGSGLYALAICFEKEKFERFNRTSSVFIGKNDEKKPYCESSDNKKILQSSFSKKLRYAILTGKTKPNKLQAILELMNSYENRHGEYLKVLIVSEVGREGINVNNVLQIHLAGPEWIQSSMYQAIARGLRATSHVDILKDKKEELKSQGIEENPVINVNIYKHAAVPKDFSDKKYPIDIHMYMSAKDGDIKIKKLMRILKQCSIGCHVQYERNVRENDEDGSFNCDYDICKYRCVDPKPDHIDYSTYTLKYSDNIINSIVEYIILLFNQRNSLTISEIIYLLERNIKNNTNEEFSLYNFVIMALEKIITEKKPILNRFGYTTYLREDSGAFYLEMFYPTSNIKPSYSMSYYSQYLISLEQRSINDIYRLYLHKENIFEKIKSLPEKELDVYLNSLSIDYISSLLETAIINYVNDNTDAIAKIIMDKFQILWFYINEPLSEIENAKNKEFEILNLTHKGPKRKNKTIKLNLDPNKLTFDTQTEKVYVHSADTQTGEKSGYANSSKLINPKVSRILKPSEISLGWRDLNNIEAQVYNAFIQIEDRTRKQHFTDVYGFVDIRDKLFKIVDKTLVKDSKVGKYIGRDCKNWAIEKLLNLLWRINFRDDPPNKQYDYDYNKISSYIKDIKKIKDVIPVDNSWDPDKIIFFHKWLTSGYDRIYMCNYIKEKMIEHNIFMK
jgi:hypothetical protein